MRSSMLLGTVVFLSFTSAVAAAQTTEKKNDYFEAKSEDGSSVIFKDDPMTAPGLDPSGATLSLRGRPMRAMLIKPRLHFVEELKKSVEAL